jgi:3',5'-cyclic AMP phosphodiesterase CpdA
MKLHSVVFSPALIAVAILGVAACSPRPAPVTPSNGVVAPSRNVPSPAAPGTLFRFVAYGDTRDHHDVHADVVAKVMAEEPALVLQTGDLVHHADAVGEWTKFDEITAALRQRIPYYPARGNHDVGTRGYYEARVTQPILSGNKLYYSFEKGNVHFVSIDTQQPLEAGSAEYVWLDDDLAKAHVAGRFLVPFFHKAIFSIGPHSLESDVRALRPILHPLFRKHGVTLVFEGHDHLYYRTRRDGITYVVTGGGGAPLYGRVAAPGPEDVYEKVHHFCVADVAPDRVTVTAYRRDLSQLDRFEVPILAPLPPP